MKLTALIRKDGSVAEHAGDVILFEGKHWLCAEPQADGGRLCYEIDWEQWKRTSGDSFKSARYPGVIDGGTHPSTVIPRGGGTEAV